MLTKKLVQSYEKINQTYYYNFEYYYYLAVKELLPEGLVLRDVVILTTMESMQKNKTNTSTQIALAVQMTPSAFSNYLKTLEKHELVERERGKENRKLMFIRLTPKGTQLIKLVKKFMQGFVRELLAQFGIKNSLMYLNVVLKATHRDPTKEPPRVSVFSPQKALQTISEGLRTINLIVFASEERAFSLLTPSLSIRELRLLYGVYSLSQQGEVTPSLLGNHLGFAMSTITSMLKTLEAKELIHRSTVKADLRKFLISLDPKALPLLEFFMNFRLRTMLESVSQLNEMEEQLLERSFALIRDYSKQFIQS
jgi:DNA-binding MarR family transcriptional regulator